MVFRDRFPAIFLTIVLFNVYLYSNYTNHKKILEMRIGNLLKQLKVFEHKNQGSSPVKVAMTTLGLPD